MLIKNIMISAFLFCIPMAIEAQAPDVLFSLALEANPELRALELEYQADLQKAPQVSQLPNPQIGIGGFVLPVETRLGPQRARLSASQGFPWFGTLRAREDLMTKQAQARFEQIASRQLEVYYQIKAAYFTLYQIEKTQAIIQRNMPLLQSLKQLAEAKVKVGATTLADVLRVDLKIQALTQELLILETQKRKPLATLNQLLYRPLDTSVRIADSLGFAELLFKKDTLLTHIHANHPMIRMFSIQQAAAHQAIAVNKLEGKPSFGLGVDYLMVERRIDADPVHNGRDIIQLNATLSIPLYREKFTAKTREETFRIAALENRKNEVESLFLSMIEKAYADSESAALTKDLYTQQIQTTKAAIHMLETNYSTQHSGFDELLQLEGDLISYDLKILRAIVQSQLARASIERYLLY